MPEKITLTGVPETMLQTVYARARESAGRGAIRDETAEQIKNALAICEAQYGEAGGSDASVFWSEAFLAPPNHRDSVLYPYVGAMTEDCTGYSLKIKRNGEGRYFIAGFTYSTEEYEVTWKKNDGITVKKRGKS